METISDIRTMREQIADWRQDGEVVALVPTLGNLHKGHMSLVSLAAEHAEHVIVSIFVNPTQFGAGEDFSDYPRTLETDSRRLSRAGVDALFLPEIEEIYPYGLENAAAVSVPGLADILCGESRPTHFDGVTSVVTRLFNIINPDVAVFGQKDYQQLVILRRMLIDLHSPVRILAGETHREDNGLALSSRNQYLKDEEKAIAPLLYSTLMRMRKRLLDGVDGLDELAAIESDGLQQLQDAGFEPEFLSFRDADDLSFPESLEGTLVLLAAAKLGAARLIDNLLIEL